MIQDLFVENSVGRAVTETINRFQPNHGVTAHFQHDIHPQMQRPQQGDEWWIEDIAKRGMAILTQDASILGIQERRQGIITSERRAVINHSAHVLALGDAKYTVWQKLRCLVAHWAAIEALLRRPGPQAATVLLSTLRIEELP